jgi:hypothetical protein
MGLPSALFFLPAPRRKRVERWLRGRWEFRTLQRSDATVVSFAKSGRTWLRLMLSRFYQLRFGLPEGSFLEFDNLHAMNPAVPRVFFSHGNYIRDYRDDWSTKRHFRGKPVVLMVRDPRDVAVSQFFQWQHRMRPSKMRLNDYPPPGAEVSRFEFVTESAVGIGAIVEWMNQWAAEMRERDGIHLVRYEDLRNDPETHLAGIVAFLGTPATGEEIAAAVDYAAFENMRRLEESGAVKGAGRRLGAGRAGDPHSFKARRAKVGGWSDYFSPEEVARIEALAATLDPVFGYGPASASRSGGEAGH